MDEFQNCVMIFDRKLNKLIDKSMDIENITLDEENKKYLITFNNHCSYTYNMSNVEWHKNPISLNISDLIIYHNNIRLTNIVTILRFGQWIKLFFSNGTSRTYNINQIKIVRNRKNDDDVKNLLSYLKDVASAINNDVVNDSDEEIGFLVKELDRIEVSEESILSHIIRKSPIKKEAIADSIIFPFSTNAAQIQAVRNALNFNISIIQGPPGTGKTQTILNIISNLLVHNKTVAVVAANNEAPKNVQEKLAVANLSGIDAFLGKSKNIKAFFEQSQANPRFETDTACTTSLNEISDISNKAEKIFEYRLREAKIRYEINELSVEKEKNDKVYNKLQHNIPQCLLKKNLSSYEYLKLSAYLDALLNKKRINLLDKLKLALYFKVFRTKYILNNIYDCIDYLQNSYYRTKLCELKAEQVRINEFLNSNDCKKIPIKLEHLSMNFLKQALFDYYERISETPFDIRTYRRHFSSFNKKYPIIYSTTHSLHYCSGNYLYDYVIIDESSQVDLVSAVIAMSCARHLVLVGDLMQLPHVVQSNDIQPLMDIFSKYSLPDYFEYTSNSVLKCISRQYGKNIPSVLLNEHYRCDPRIIDFCNKRFYNNMLQIQTEHKENNGIFIISNKPHYERNRSNERQIDNIVNDVFPKLQFKKFGIIAPYRNQVELIKQKLTAALIDKGYAETDIENIVNTVHKFQGKEREAIILSTVSDRIIYYDDEKKSDFLNNENLINVAISRAKEILFVMVSETIIDQKGSLINDLARYYTYYCGDCNIIASKTYSVFDLMYDEYAPILEGLKQRLLNVSKNQSENIIATVLKDICNTKEFRYLNFKFNYPLRKFIDCDYLSDIEDRQFVSHENSHCDFIIYNKMDKSIFLAIEVDGSSHTKAIQQRRDKRKDRILAQCGIPLLRIGTTESNIEDKIKRALYGSK